LAETSVVKNRPSVPYGANFSFIIQFLSFVTDINLTFLVSRYQRLVGDWLFRQQLNHATAMTYCLLIVAGIDD